MPLLALPHLSWKKFLATALLQFLTCYKICPPQKIRALHAPGIHQKHLLTRLTAELPAELLALADAKGTLDM